MIATDIDDLRDAAFDKGGCAFQHGHTGLWRGAVGGVFHLAGFFGASAGDRHDGLGIGLQEEIQAEDLAGRYHTVRIAVLLDADSDQAGFVGHLRDPVYYHGVDIVAVFGGEGIEAIGHHFQRVFDFVVRHEAILL